MKLKGFEQLRLRDVDWSYPDNRKKETWKGKVVEKVGFAKSNCESKQMFLIMFTDKTYICIGLQVPEHEDEDYKLCDHLIYDQSVYRNQLEIYHAWPLDDGTIQYDTWVQMLIDFGMYKMDDETTRRIIEEHKRAEEEREYAQYLRLKEKYENKDSKEI